VDARAVGDVLVDRLRERVRLLEHHADAGAQFHDVDRLVVDVLAVERDVAADAAPSMVSFMRFRQRRKVDLPQPDGPISAVTCFSRTSEVDAEQRLLLAVVHGDLVARILIVRWSCRSWRLTAVFEDFSSSCSYRLLQPTSGARTCGAG
jgi:hypothetical protein